MVRQINKQKEPACMPDIRREVQRIIKAATTPVNGKLPPYAPVAVKYLYKKLRQRGVEVFSKNL